MLEMPINVPNFRDLTGLTFNRWKVLKYAGKGKWECVCICGNEAVLRSYKLNSGHSKSCGCLKIEEFRKRATKHGMSKTPEFRSYSHAKERCENPNDAFFPSYGGRGILFCFPTFEVFFQVLGPRPEKNCSIERINNDGHYEAGNVRWATPKEQARNRRSNRMITIGVESLPVAEWAERFDINQIKLLKRINRNFCDDCLFLPGRHFCKHKAVRYEN